MMRKLSLCSFAVICFGISMTMCFGGDKSPASAASNDQASATVVTAEQQCKSFMTKHGIDLVKNQKPIAAPVLKEWKQLAQGNSFAASNLATYNMSLKTAEGYKETIAILQQASKMKTATPAQKAEFQKRIIAAQKQLNLTTGSANVVPVKPAQPSGSASVTPPAKPAKSPGA